MDAKEYYNKTRLVETRNWTLDMAISFANEYHSVVNNTNYQAKELSKKVKKERAKWIGIKNNKDGAEFNQRVIEIYRKGKYLGNLLVHKDVEFTEEEYDDMINNFIMR